MRFMPSDVVGTFDLEFRPWTYGEHPDPVSVILAEVAGEPGPPISDEVTIARIVLGTLSPNVVELRAWRLGNHFRYRIVDDLETKFCLWDRMSGYPLSLGQLIKMIGKSSRIGEEAGLVFPVLDTVFRAEGSKRDTGYRSAGDRSALVDAVRAFVSVESDLYPELERYFEWAVDAWLTCKGCLTGPGHLEGIDRRSLEPELSPVPAWSSVAGPHAEAIGRLVRAWWRSQRAPHTIDVALDLGRKTNQLRNALRTYVSRHGRLPTGRFHVGAGQSKWTVEIDDLTETAELIERVLIEGSDLPATEPEWLAGCQEHLAVYEFGSWLYIAHAGGVDGPFDEETASEWFNEEMLGELGELVVELEWDSGGPGAGAGVVSVYRLFELFFVTDDMGLNGPYEDFESAVRHHGVYTINGATTRIWDAEHGLVFERGVLYRPDVVEQYGKVYVDVTIDQSEETVTPHR